MVLKINSHHIYTQLARQGITQLDLAKRSNTTQQAISMILRRGSCEPRTAGKIARALNVDVDELIMKEGVS